MAFCEFIDNVKKDFLKLPKDLNVSTVGFACKLNTTCESNNIARYVDLKYDGIVAVNYGYFNNKATNRTIIFKKKQKNPQKKAFFNQVSLTVRVTGSTKVHVKIFSNGSIQMANCKNADEIVEALEILYKNLKLIKAIPDYENKVMIEKHFVNNHDALCHENITKFKICLINTDFNIKFNIDREKLFDLGIKKGIQCTYDPMKHACVNIKYKYKTKNVTIFVFEKGSIIITGSKNCDQIASTYNFINKYLLENYNSIKKIHGGKTIDVMDLLK